MLLSIAHQTNYKYQEKVQFNPHQIYLKPLQRAHLLIEDYTIRISPDPEGSHERYSIEGNPYVLTWFKDPHQELAIDIKIKIWSHPYNPFGFIIAPHFADSLNVNHAPHFSYLEKDLPILQPYLMHDENPLLLDFGKYFLPQQDPLAILTAINAAIYQDWEHIIREEETLWDPGYTFDQKKGSCRDLAWMMMHTTRGLGLASRFVSGYAFNPELTSGHELHAWVEVYLPGAGWVGLDPNLGLLVDEHYIPLACSFHPENTLPVHGSVGGDRQVSSSLETHVVIKKISD